jgi:hypothetical protein
MNGCMEFGKLNVGRSALSHDTSNLLPLWWLRTTVTITTQKHHVSHNGVSVFT